MCPWPRFQSALLDEDSMVVTYQGWRGEPRGKHKKGQPWDGRGDCIDCKNCVAVCPTGIDIRDGLQLECIGCGLCIDACDDVMNKVGRPRGLVDFDTERNQIARAEGRPTVKPWSRTVRPRTIIYTGILTVVAAVLLLTLGTRASVDINVLHDRNPLFVTLSDGSIRNGYTIRILNMERAERSFSLVVDGVEGAELSVLGTDEREPLLSARPDTTATYRVFVAVPPGAVDGETTPVEFVLTDTVSGETARQPTVFRGPT